MRTRRARSSGTVVAAALWKYGRLAHCYKAPAITHAHLAKFFLAESAKSTVRSVENSEVYGHSEHLVFSASTPRPITMSEVAPVFLFMVFIYCPAR
jgi:hypothetical protein